MRNRNWTINLSPEADEDLIEIWGYLAREASVRVADGQLSEIDAAFEMLKSWPYAGRKRTSCLPAYDRYRSTHIFYRVQPDVVEIFRVLHGRRDVAAILTSNLPKNRST